MIIDINGYQSELNYGIDVHKINSCVGSTEVPMG